MHTRSVKKRKAADLFRFTKSYVFLTDIGKAFLFANIG